MVIKATLLQGTDHGQWSKLFATDTHQGQFFFFTFSLLGHDVVSTEPSRTWFEKFLSNDGIFPVLTTLFPFFCSPAYCSLSFYIQREKELERWVSKDNKSMCVWLVHRSFCVLLYFKAVISYLFVCLMELTRSASTWTIVTGVQSPATSTVERCLLATSQCTAWKVELEEGAVSVNRNFIQISLSLLMFILYRFWKLKYEINFKVHISESCWW